MRCLGGHPARHAQHGRKPLCVLFEPPGLRKPSEDELAASPGTQELVSYLGPSALSAAGSLRDLHPRGQIFHPPQHYGSLPAAPGKNVKGVWAPCCWPVENTDSQFFPITAKDIHLGTSQRSAAAAELSLCSGGSQRAGVNAIQVRYIAHFVIVDPGVTHLQCQAPRQILKEAANGSRMVKASGIG